MLAYCISLEIGLIAALRTMDEFPNGVSLAGNRSEGNANKNTCQQVKQEKHPRLTVSIARNNGYFPASKLFVCCFSFVCLYLHALLGHTQSCFSGLLQLCECVSALCELFHPHYWSIFISILAIFLPLVTLVLLLV